MALVCSQPVEESHPQKQQPLKTNQPDHCLPALERPQSTVQGNEWGQVHKEKSLQQDVCHLILEISFHLLALKYSHMNGSELWNRWKVLEVLL